MRSNNATISFEIPDEIKTELINNPQQLSSISLTADVAWTCNGEFCDDSKIIAKEIVELQDINFKPGLSIIDIKMSETVLYI